MTDKTFTLNTGQQMPAVGLGTWQGEPGKLKIAVSHALRNGYRLIDGAYCYGNEEEVGAGLKEAFDAGVKREDVFVVTKVWASYNTRVQLALDKSLAALGLDYVDLLLIHWPALLNPEGNHDKFPTIADGTRDVIHGWDPLEAWRQMEALPATGRTKAIGVSNYSKPYLEKLLGEAKIVPAVNQIEQHPSLPQDEIVALSKANGIHIMGYSPLGSTGSPLLSAEPVVKIAEKRGVSPGTVLLSWNTTRGSTVLAKSVTPARIISNKEVVELDAEDMKLLADFSEDLKQKGQLKRYVYPPFKTQFGFPDKL